MRATAKGIEINREELWALLAFTGDSEQYSAIHFRVNGRSKLEAAATDGKKSVECIAKAEQAEPIEIAIDAGYLEKCRAALASGEALIIELGPKGVKNIAIVDLESGKKIMPTIGWNRDAATTQVTMGTIVGGLKLPSDKNHTGTWAAFDPAAWKALDRIKVATDGCPVTQWPPVNPSSPLYFEARSDEGHWKASVLPEKVLGPGEERDEPEDEDEGAPGRNDRQTRLDLADRAKAPKAEAESGIVDDNTGEDADETEPELGTEKRKRKVKASQMRPKKGSKKS
jgi:hypothetical protein